MKTLIKRALLACALLLGLAFAAPALAAPDCTTTTAPNTQGTTANATFEILQKLCANSGAGSSALLPGTAVIGDVGTASFSVSCSSLVLPAASGTFTSGYLAANSATAGSVTPLTCSLARYNGGPITITKGRLSTGNTSLSAANFVAHVYTGTPTVTGGNNAAFVSSLSGHFCKLAITLDQAFSDGAEGSGVPISGTTCTRVLAAGTQTVNVLIEAKGAYAYTASQTFTLTLEGFN